MLGYKIFDIDNEKNLKFLFHGLNHSRNVTQNKWLKAKKIKGRDGTGKRYYTTGFHFFKTLHEAEKWPGRMINREIVKISVKNTRLKNHRSNVFLADKIKVNYETK